MLCSCCVRSSMPAGAMISTPIGNRAHFDLDFALVQLTFAQHLAEFLPSVLISRLCFGLGRESDRFRARQQSVEHAFFRGIHARGGEPFPFPVRASSSPRRPSSL